MKKQEGPINPDMPEIFRGTEGGRTQKTPAELDLGPVVLESLAPGKKVYLRRRSGTGDDREMYYPCTVVEKDGELMFSNDTDIPSWPPGYGPDHSSGFLMEVGEYADSLYEKI